MMQRNDLANQLKSSFNANLYKRELERKQNGALSETYSLSESLLKSSYRQLSTPRFQVFDSETNYDGKGLSPVLLSEGVNLPLVININLNGEFYYCYETINKEMKQWKSNTMNVYSSSQLSSQSCFQGKTNLLAVIFSKNMLEDLSLQMPDLFDPLLSQYEQGKTNQLFSHHRICTPSILLLARQIKNINTNDPLFQIYLESKILELLFLAFRKNQEEGAVSLSPDEQEKIIEARNILCKEYQNPPSLKQLALSVGSNELKLKQGFKVLFNNTVYNFIIDIRMQKASQYLLETRLPIVEIAYLVGFEHQSSFTKAFKKYFGVTPQQYRFAQRVVSFNNLEI